MAVICWWVKQDVKREVAAKCDMKWMLCKCHHQRFVVCWSLGAYRCLSGVLGAAMFGLWDGRWWGCSTSCLCWFVFSLTSSSAQWRCTAASSIILLNELHLITPGAVCAWIPFNHYTASLCGTPRKIKVHLDFYWQRIHFKRAEYGSWSDIKRLLNNSSELIKRTCIDEDAVHEKTWESRRLAWANELPTVHMMSVCCCGAHQSIKYENYNLLPCRGWFIIHQKITNNH